MRQSIEMHAIQDAHDLSKVFRGNEKTLYVDPMHLGPEGNSLMAQEFIRLIMEMEEQGLNAG